MNPVAIPRRSNKPIVATRPISQPSSQMLAGRGSTKNRSANRQSMIIEEDEYIAEVVGAATAANFGTTAYPINIGQAVTFPWGSGVVRNNFEKYRFEYLEFYFKREVSEFATNGTTGKVMLHVDFDAADGPPTTKQQVEDSDPHSDGMPCENINLIVPQHSLERLTDGWFVRPGGLPGSTDIKTYDVGNLYVSTQGLAANSAIVGELHVRYRCKVYVPVLDALNGAPSNHNAASYGTLTTETFADSVTSNLLVANVRANGLGIVNTAGSFALPAGNYYVSAHAAMLDGTAEAASLRFTPTLNGVSLVGSVPPSTTTVAGAVSELLSISWSDYISVPTAGSLFTLPTLATGAAGTLLVTGQVTFLAV